MRIGLLKNNTITSVIEARSGDPYGTEGTDWLDMSDKRGGIGWVWDGSNLTPPVKPTTYRTQVTPSEFVELFPAAAYLDIKNNLVGTNAEITQLYEFAFLKDTINLKSSKMAAAMALLVANSSLTQAEADAILQGIPE